MCAADAPFQFSAAKFIQACGVVLRFHGGQASYLRVLKLLYIAERDCLQQRGQPMIGGRLVAMKNGPLHSEGYDLIKGQHIAEPDFFRCFERRLFSLRMIQDPGVEELSPWEVERLDDACQRHAEQDDWELVEETHRLPEWVSAYVPDTSKTIPLADVLRTAPTPLDLDAVLHAARLQAHTRRIFDL
jgi:uncharacterized phage-associated protein